jgi:aminopeptidase
LEVKKDENIVLFCDDEKLTICEAFAGGALELGLRTRMVTLKTEPDVFRKEIPKEVKQVSTKQKTDIFVNLMRGIREETPFRIRLTKLETENQKTRLAHCPGIMLDMLTEGALALTTRDHRQMQGSAKNMIRDLSNATTVNVTNSSGTDISMSVNGRPFYTDTMIDWKTLKWMNMPTGEVIVAPVENSLEGRLVCDMAIGGIGPLKCPLEITAKRGKVQDISSADGEVLKKVKETLQTDAHASTVGEFAFGINPKARFVEEFLEAEKMLGTIHVTFGNNTDMPGGKNPSKSHMDMLISEPTVTITKTDGSKSKVLVNGIFSRG